MNTRLIAWGLAATGFLAAFTTFAWHRDVGAPTHPPPPQITRGERLIPFAVAPQEPSPLHQDPDSEAPESEAPPLILPLPAATQPEADPGIQPVPDDQPTVDDLPAPRRAPESSPGD